VRKRKPRKQDMSGKIVSGRKPRMKDMSGRREREKDEAQKAGHEWKKKVRRMKRRRQEMSGRKK
jgi:hypothetical protein